MIGAKSNLTDNDLSCFGMNMLLQFCFVKQRDGESSHLLLSAVLESVVRFLLRDVQ